MSEIEHTPGPWRWEVNRSSRRVELCGGVPRFDKLVMSFRRWGMQSATPEFCISVKDPDWSKNVKSAAELAVPAKGREHHAHWFADIDHPDARLIAAAPDLLKAQTMGASHNTPDFLDWVADRLIHLYGESPDVDFVLSLRARAQAGRDAIAKAEGRQL